MLILILVSIYIYNRYKKLAEEKGYKGSAWGARGILMYLGISLGLPLTIGVLIGIFYLNDENFELDTGLDIMISFGGYIVGGIASYMYYQHLKNKPYNPELRKHNMSDFGKPETDDQVNFE